MSASLTPVAFDDLPGWAADDPRPVLAGLADCARHSTASKPYRTGSLGLTPEDFAPVFDASLKVGDMSDADARRFFERQFAAFHIAPVPDGKGLVTGYYEPDIAVSDKPDRQFRYPIFRRPDDLVELDAGNRPAGVPESYAFGRLADNGITPYPDRRAIDCGFLTGRRLEIAWADSKVDVFFLHIQGAARLRFGDGTVRRVTYAAKTGHPFTAIGRVLVERGEMRVEDVTMDSLRAWLADHPEHADDLMWQNRSYIFFRETPVGDPQRGPIAAAKVPLRAARSLAVDRSIHTFGTPIFVRADTLTHLTGGPFRRLMLAQDTGSAILGPARGDIFVGGGADAGSAAGRVRHGAEFAVLVPKAAAGRYLS